jgi:hypothetical protein
MESSYFHNIQIPFQAFKSFEGEIYKPTDWQTWPSHFTLNMESKESSQINPSDSQTSAEEQEVALIWSQRSTDVQNWMTVD